MSSDRPILTTTAGAPVPDNNHSLSAGPRGPLLLQDYQLIEKLAHQNRERIPERVVHAKGSGAYGTFTVTGDITKYTKAKVFTPGSKTDLLMRFSTVAGERGAADAERDVRGFSVKFYTEDGNWDMVGNNTPVFFVRDPMKFPDFIRTQKRHPRTNMRSATAMWDFWSLSPESLHQVTILFSDRGLPKNYRTMNGYGSHTFSLWNDAGERYWVKFHFKTMNGHEYWTNDEGNSIIAVDRESSQRDLYESIDKGQFPQWRLCVQVMPEMDAEKTSYNPFDLTKVWPHDEYPLIEVGVLRAEPQSRALLRRDRAVLVLAVQHRAGHRLLARQDAAGPHLRLRRRAPLPGRHELREPAGQRAQEPEEHLPCRRPDALRRAEGRRRLLRAELLQRPGRAAVRQGAAAAHQRRRGPLRPPRRQRTITAKSPPCSASSGPSSSSASTATSPPPCRACRNTSSTGSSNTSAASTRPTRQASPRPSPPQRSRPTPTRSRPRSSQSRPRPRSSPAALPYQKGGAWPP